MEYTEGIILMDSILEHLCKKLLGEMQHQGINYAELARKADVNPSFIYDILSGKSLNPSVVKLSKVSEALGVGVSDLIGDGGRSVTSLDYNQSPTSANKSDSYIEIPWAEKKHELQPPTICFRKSYVEQYIHANTHYLRLIQVHDDVMSPTLLPNDLLLIDTHCTQVAHAGLYALKDTNHSTIRRLEPSVQLSTERVRLIADNTSYSSFSIAAKDLKVMGRVVWRSSIRLE
jgi:transcriptional regulator with XRE-family HTH domain